MASTNGTTSTTGVTPIVATVFLRDATTDFQNVITNIRDLGDPRASSSQPVRVLYSQPSSPSSISTIASVLEISFILSPNRLQASTGGIWGILRDIRQSHMVVDFEAKYNAQVVLQPESVYRRHKRLAVFDMDSTLIQQEVIDEIAAELGPSFQQQVSAITARAMNGELDFTASLRERCRLLKGVPVTVWETLKPRITITPGAKELVKALKKLGCKTAVLSGGFTPLATWLAGELGLDYVYANHLVMDPVSQTLTGEVEGDIVHAERKRELVREIAAREGIDLRQTLVVGDGANDLLMMGVAGTGVAFNAKEKVQKVAPIRMADTSLRSVLYLLGLSWQEQEELLREG